MTGAADVNRHISLNAPERRNDGGRPQCGRLLLGASTRNARTTSRWLPRRRGARTGGNRHREEGGGHRHEHGAPPRSRDAEQQRRQPAFETDGGDDAGGNPDHSDEVGGFHEAADDMLRLGAQCDSYADFRRALLRLERRGAIESATCEQPPRGGNRHKEEIEGLWNAYAKCQALFLKKCVPKPKCGEKCKQVLMEARGRCGKCVALLRPWGNSRACPGAVMP